MNLLALYLGYRLKDLMYKEKAHMEKEIQEFFNLYHKEGQETN